MSIEVTSDPAAEPVSTADAKAHMGVSISTDDTRIDEIVVAVRKYVEGYIKRSLITQTLRLKLDAFPRSPEIIRLPRSPVQSVTSINYLDSNGDSTLLASSSYVTDLVSSPARIQPAFGEVFPATRGIFDSVTIIFVAGYGAAATAIPEDIVHAIKILTQIEYDNPGGQSFGAVLNENDYGVKGLLDPHKLHWSNS